MAKDQLAILVTENRVHKLVIYMENDRVEEVEVPPGIVNGRMAQWASKEAEKRGQTAFPIKNMPYAFYFK